MKSIEVSGKTVKDAIRQGLAELNCDSGDVDIQVLEMGSPGLFGMFGKNAKVRLSMKEADKDLDFEMPVFTLDQPSGKGRGDKKKQEKSKGEKKSELVQEAEAVKADAPKTEKKPSKRRENRPKDVSTEVRQPEPMQHEEFVPTPEEQLTDTAKNARTFLSGLTEKMGIPVEIVISESEEQLKMQLSGENMSILIGRRGETLDALQYLTSLNVNRSREDYLRVSLDTENYRAKREEALRKLAVRMAGRAKKSGRRVALEPMNPYERRILHSALQGDPDVTTHSEGEEPYRRIIITLK